jgi:hypothetical protein
MMIADVPEDAFFGSGNRHSQSLEATVMSQPTSQVKVNSVRDGCGIEASWNGI